MKNYKCNSCKIQFNTPQTRYDDIGDEQYDECPFCGSDNYDANIIKVEGTDIIFVGNEDQVKIMRGEQVLLSIQESELFYFIEGLRRFQPPSDNNIDWKGIFQDNFNLASHD